MIYSDLILRKEQWQRLTTAWVKERLAHAYLFYGPPGSGKEGHAIELAALVNCRQLGDPEAGACGQCPACRKVLSLQHPNIQVVVPLPRRNPIEAGDPPLKALRPADIENLSGQLAAKAKDPYFTIHMEGANTILINSVRELRRTAYLRAAEPGWRAVLIFEAEKLGIPQADAANALLKLLEEPPDETVFILVTHRPHLLLDTIRSRCLGLYFPPLTVEQVAGHLTQYRGVPAAEARIVAQASDGSLTRARQMAEQAGENGGGLYEGLDPLVAALLTPKPSGWQRQVNVLAQLRYREPLAFAYRMQLLAVWLRDLLVLDHVPDGAGQVTFSGRRAELEGFLEAYPEADWGAAAAAVEQALRLLERNVQPTLVLTNLFLDVRAAAKGKASELTPLTL